MIFMKKTCIIFADCLQIFGFNCNVSRNFQLRCISRKFSSFVRPTRAMNFPIHRSNVLYIQIGDDLATVSLALRYRNTETSAFRTVFMKRSASENAADTLERLHSKLFPATKSMKRKSDATSNENLGGGWRSQEKNLPSTSNEHSGERSIRLLDTSSGVPVNAAGMVNLSAFVESHQLLIGETPYRISLNPVSVVKLRLETRCMIGMPVVPNFALSNGSKGAQFYWYVSKLSSVSKTIDYDWKNSEPSIDDWTNVGTGFTFCPDASHIDKYLLVVCIPESSSEFDVVGQATVCKTSVQSAPTDCIFNDRIQQISSSPVLEFPAFRCLSYNVLADLYADKSVSFFPYCPAEAMTFGYRWPLIFQELHRYAGDVYCLQECDTKLFVSYLEKFMDSLGYQGYFAKKGQDVNEGCAIFFKRSLFECVQYSSAQIAEFISDEACKDFAELSNRNKDFKEFFLGRNNCVQVAVLKPKSEKFRHKNIVVANTHLFFHPYYPHMKLLQAALCLRFVQICVGQVKGNFPTEHAEIIFCGDLNSTADSAVYQLFTVCQVPSDHDDWNLGKQ